MFNNIKIKNMKFFEKDLETLIYESDKDQLDDRGLYVNGIIKRQLKIGNYGIADLVTFERLSDAYDTNKLYRYLNITVYELKREIINEKAFFQALKYVKGIKTYFEKYKPDLNLNFNIALIGSEVELNSSFIYLTDFIQHNSINMHNEGLLSNFNIYTYKYKIDGIHFNLENNYNLIKKGF